MTALTVKVNDFTCYKFLLLQLITVGFQCPQQLYLQPFSTQFYTQIIKYFQIIQKHEKHSTLLKYRKSLHYIVFLGHDVFSDKTKE